MIENFQKSMQKFYKVKTNFLFNSYIISFICDCLKIYDKNYDVRYKLTKRVISVTTFNLKHVFKDATSRANEIETLTGIRHK